MKKNRKAAEEVIYKWLDKLDPSGVNTALKKEMFAAMSDEQFDRHMEAIRQQKDYVSFVVPNLRKDRRISTANTLKVGKEMGIEFFQKIWITDPITGVTYLTPNKFLVCHPPVRRQIQTLENKMAVASNSKKVDELTNQVTGDSGASGISFPELLVMVSQGHTRSVEEFMKVRGGDLTALNYSDQSLYQTGTYSLDTIATLGTRAKATITLGTFFTAMHFDHNF